MRNNETGLLRLAAPKESNSKSRWMYEWKGQRGAKYLDAIEFTPKVLADRPSVLITEEGERHHDGVPQPRYFHQAEAWQINLKAPSGPFYARFI